MSFWNGVRSAASCISFSSLKSLVESAPQRFRAPLVALIRAVVFLPVFGRFLSTFTDWVSYWSYTGDISAFGASCLTSLFFAVSLAGGFLVTAFVEQLYKRLSLLLGKPAGADAFDPARLSQRAARLWQALAPVSSRALKACGAVYAACQRAADWLLDRAPSVQRKISQ